MKGQKIYITIVVLSLLFLISLPFIKIPISATSFGVINDLKNNVPIMSMVDGKVVKSKIIRNNQIFKKGDTIIEINTDQLVEQGQFQANQFSDFSAQLYDLQLLSKGNISNIRTGVYQKQVAAFKEKNAQLQANLDLAVKDFERISKLYNEGIYTQAEYDKNKYNVEYLKRQIENSRQQQFATWRGEKLDLERMIRQNKTEIKTTKQKLDNFIIKSPENGRLIEYSGLQVGSFVNTGVKIGVVSPEETLVIEARVSPRDIGLIKINQKVKVQIDTYNYNQWGLLTGNVIEIQKNISYDENQNAYFIVYCSMDKNYLKLKNNYKAKVEKGMTLNVRFYLLERTLWQLLFDSLDDWFNPNLGK